MTDLPRTARYSLPLLALAQAQKEVTHNEALVLLDALVQAAVVAGPIADPPSAPEEGQCWLVAAGASGAWAGHGGKLAVRTGGGWRYVTPGAGFRLTRQSDGAALYFDGTAWIAPPTIATPAGGVTIDVEARSAIAAFVLLLEAHGLLISG
ncbi:hypothetical protein ATE67_16605 [Sphingopyxis sp. H050]|uniref:DUF2793 domain-containing protein n=1 Tax=Sphingopyxis sp. H050 TaxID=1759072 RepID=UPI0007365E65|nr:DUF2793 domain-containing protein [Sphingopyxis sp. H050]KTE19173.1 hypothetical protein ATE67_16605 [Sphingopyxis sp. H050]